MRSRLDALAAQLRDGTWPARPRRRCRRRGGPRGLSRRRRWLLCGLAPHGGAGQLPQRRLVELRARDDAELGEDLVQVTLDGPRADEQRAAITWLERPDWARRAICSSWAVSSREAAPPPTAARRLSCASSRRRADVPERSQASRVRPDRGRVPTAHPEPRRARGVPRGRAAIARHSLPLLNRGESPDRPDDIQRVLSSAPRTRPRWGTPPAGAARSRKGDRGP
jgi:hypothetical protein